MKKRYKYDREYAQKILKFFSVAHTVEKYEVTTDKNGEKVKTVEKPNPLPTFEKFAVSIGVTVEAIKHWEKTRPEFRTACEQCRALQKDMINDIAMRGYYNPTYTIFVAKNLTDMKDKQEANVDNFESVRQEYLKAMKNLGKKN